MIKYIAEFRYGGPALTEITVRKETPKTVVVESSRKIIGHTTTWPGAVLRRESNRIFDTKRDAVAWLLEMAEENTKSTGKQLDKAIKYEEALRLSLVELAAQERVTP